HSSQPCRGRGIGSSTNGCLHRHGLWTRPSTSNATLRRVEHTSKRSISRSCPIKKEEKNDEDNAQGPTQRRMASRCRCRGLHTNLLPTLFYKGSAHRHPSPRRSSRSSVGRGRVW